MSEKRLIAALRQKYPDLAVDHYKQLLLPYVDSHLSPTHVLSEVETGDEGKFWSCVWEAMLYQHFTSIGYKLRKTATKSGQHSPDFCIELPDKLLWVEAIVPSPEGIPTDWLTLASRNTYAAVVKPTEKMLLRCTSALAAKRDKIAGYQTKGTITPRDQTVIALSICRLSDYDVDGNGLGNLPLTVGAVFPLGPLAFPVTREGKFDGPARHLPRFTLPKDNGTSVPTYAFLDQRFSNVSALLQGHQKDLYGKDIALSLIHNPLASNKVSTRTFFCQREFIAQPDGDDYRLRDILAEG